MDHVTLKLTHIILAAASLGGFMLRWFGVAAGASWVKRKPVRVLPHAVDSLFLATGIWLAIRIGQAPLADVWLTAKTLGLVAYIVLGTLALKRARTSRGRTIAFVAAVTLFGWIASVARLRDASGFLHVLTP